MQDHTSFFRLVNEGFIHHIHSDAYHIYMHYEDAEDNALYRLTLNKDYYIEEVEEIECEIPIDELDFVKWHRPETSRLGDLVFTGCLKEQDGLTYKFTIGKTKMTVGDTIELNDSFTFEDIPALAGKEVEHHIQKGNFLYALVWNTELDSYGAYEFLEIALANNAVLRRYTLNCGDGELIVNAMNIDYWCNRIYIAGMKEVSTSSYEEVKFRPYLETLLYNQTQTPLKGT